MIKQLCLHIKEGLSFYKLAKKSHRFSDNNYTCLLTVDFKIYNIYLLGVLYLHPQNQINLKEIKKILLMNSYKVINYRLNLNIKRLLIKTHFYFKTSNIKLKSESIYNPLAFNYFIWS